MLCVPKEISAVVHVLDAHDCNHALQCVTVHCQYRARSHDHDESGHDRLHYGHHDHAYADENARLRHDNLNREHDSCSTTTLLTPNYLKSC